MRRIYLILFIIADLALVLRLAAIAAYGVTDIVTASESGITANNFVSGKGYTFDFYGQRPDHPLQSYMPPMYTALIAFSLQASSSPARILEFSQALLSTLTVIILFFFTWQLSSRPGLALLTTLGAATYPVLVLMCAIPIQTTLNVFLLSALMLAIVMLQKHFALKWASLTGALFGINLLTRPAMLGFLPLLLVWLWLNATGDWKKLLKAAAAILIFTTITAAPWVLRNYQGLGRFGVISTYGGFTFWNGNNPFTTGGGFDIYSEKLDEFLGVAHDPKALEIINPYPYPLPKQIKKQVGTVGEVELERMLYGAGLDFIRNDPKAWLELVVAKVVGFLWFRPNIGEKYEASWTKYYQILYSGLLVLLIPGLLLSLRQWRSYLLLYLLFLYNALVYIMFIVLTRYRWEIEPFFLVFAALTISYLFAKARGSSSMNRSLAPG